MKKLFVLFIPMLLGSLILLGVFANGAQAGQENDVWTKVHADWPDSHGYYKASPNGVVHEKWSCNSNWQDCDGNALYFLLSEFKDPVEDTPCGDEIDARLWEGTTEYDDDEGDVSDLLIIGETYWFCDTLGEEVFRRSE